MSSDPATNNDTAPAAPVAYLVNVYPKVSHTFVRREIQALEAMGQPVLRISVRHSEDLVDPEDRDEDVLTTVLLERGRLWGPMCRAVVRPWYFLRSLRQAGAMARASGGGFLTYLRHGVYFAEACRLRELTRAAGVWHVHAHFGTNPAAVARLCRLLGGPTYSFTVHGPEEFDRPIQLSLSSKVADAAFVAGVSSFGRSQLMRWINQRHWNRVRVVRCGLDGAYLAADPACPNEPPEDPGNLLVCVGRLSEQKGQHLLVEAVSRLTREGVDVRLRLIGDGPMRGDLEAAAAELGVADRIEFTGSATADQVRDHLRDARGFVLPSFAEGLPVVIMEALAMRRPVISTYVAGIPELVDSGCGQLVPAGDIDALTQAMARLLAATPEQLAEMGAEGRRRVCASHDAGRIAEDLLDAFRGTDEPRSSGGGTGSPDAENPAQTRNRSDGAPTNGQLATR